MSKDLKDLMEQLSQALGEAIQESEKIRLILRQIEESGHSTNLTLAVLLGLKDQGKEFRTIVYGSERAPEKNNSTRRISAFDRRFLRALRIRLSD